MSHKKLRPFIVKVSVLGYFPLYHFLFGYTKYHNPTCIYEMTIRLTHTYFVDITHFYKINKY